MIANTLIFLLGMLVTTLGAMILAPLFWRKAQSLARREFEATVPISANEIRAEFDRVRAEAAVAIRRQEVLSADAREKAAKADAHRGRLVVETAELQKRNRRLTQTLEEQDVELEATRAVLAKREDEIRRLTEAFDELRQEAELTAQEFEALGTRFRDLGEVAEEQTIELAAAKIKIERLEARLGLAEGQDIADDARIEELNAENAGLQRSLRQERAAAGVREDKIAALAAQLSKSDAGTAGSAKGAAPKAPDVAAPPGRRMEEPHRSGSPRFDKAIGRRELPALEPAEEADIRERISEVAARVIRMTALAEGPGSPLASLLEAAKSDAPAAAGSRPTLADRVRILAEAERKTGS